MSTVRKFVGIKAYPEILFAILLNEVTSAKKLLTAALVTHPCTCVSFTYLFLFKNTYHKCTTMQNLVTMATWCIGLVHH
jgi:hypothetical protein